MIHTELRTVTEAMLDKMQKQGWWTGPDEARVLSHNRPCAWDINCGWCGDWADAAEQQIGGEAIDLDSLAYEKFGLPDGIFEEVSHTVLYRDGLFHDAQDIAGVRDPRDLQVVRGVTRETFLAEYNK